MSASPADETCLWLDPVTGRRVSYGDLRALVGAAEVEWRPWLRPETHSDAVIGIVAALLLGQSLTLVDADFSVEEVQATGATPSRIAGRVSVPGRKFESVISMLATIRGAMETDNGFRLTLFTSGSTGLPKQVTHGLAGLGRMVRLGDRHRDDVWGLAYNPTHIAGVQVILQAFFNGNTLVQLFGHDAETAWRAIRNDGLTHLSATPSFYRLLLGASKIENAETACSSVRAVTLGGERSDDSLRSRLSAMFPAARIRNVYASTEAGALFVSDGEVFSIPPALEGRVRIVDGELHVAADLLGEFAGGAEAVSEGWYRTGDRVAVENESPLKWRILSRDRDWVNVGGHKVNPSEVETILLAYPGVREARVFGRSNSVLGQILCAEIVAVPEPAEADLRAYLADRLQLVKLPRLIRFVAAIARSRTGKATGSAGV